jgi:ABC-type multidrug transport system fused ATPase/permease subunit
MSEEAKKFHEEEAIEKTYDLRVTLRLLGYLKPYWKMTAVALVLTFLTNILISLQPYFTKMAVDDYITPKGHRRHLVVRARLFLRLFVSLFIFLHSGNSAERRRAARDVRHQNADLYQTPKSRSRLLR